VPGAIPRVYTKPSTTSYSVGFPVLGPVSFSAVVVAQPGNDASAVSRKMDAPQYFSGITGGVGTLALNNSFCKNIQRLRYETLSR